MHDVLRQRLMRHIESLPEEQVYQVLDFIEFLESKYARDLRVESSGLQKFAENLEDRMRKKAMNPATLREAFQLISAADRVLSSVSTAGRQIIDDLGSLAEGEEGPSLSPGRPSRPEPGARRRSPASPPAGPSGGPSRGSSGGASRGPSGGPSEEGDGS